VCWVRNPTPYIKDVLRRLVNSFFGQIFTDTTPNRVFPRLPTPNKGALTDFKSFKTVSLDPMTPVRGFEKIISPLSVATVKEAQPATRVCVQIEVMQTLGVPAIAIGLQDRFGTPWPFGIPQPVPVGNLHRTDLLAIP